MAINSKKILIVDDEPISLKVLSEYLEGENLNLEFAENGKQALAILEKEPKNVSLVIMDRIMPFMSGMEVFQVMKQSNLLKKIPVIMLTGMTEKEDIIDAVDAGVFDYLTKPVNKNLLVSLVRRAIGSTD